MRLVRGDAGQVPHDLSLRRALRGGRPGDRIPADGEIAEGTSGVDDGPVTGESVPSSREASGEPVFCASNTASPDRGRTEANHMCPSVGWGL
ncbi:hypothetical protein DPM13_09580 [Paracoccus mutanolyticus]|uniref:P-type ATPase A domain-containing protein n=1 Tax=Paracoccus mutanolyticus TaxID=1499308 RepID=A0ABM6WUR4_9RHOB|nr:hypothetical protein DPM13_09580 [Paracoccus mutanolyticus]